MSDQTIAAGAAEIAARAESELEQLVGISSPSGDVRGGRARRSTLCATLLPEGARRRAPAMLDTGERAGSAWVA